ncbi:aromatic ring-hydroxylating oxygenase subunit alpha [Sphaerisporangium krabiense]|uniref:Phenylpropionate dioxygenase-like ring-hydroxylating dioxygenase large terminal subunit n=1 Tax=Sphaerisporangium krabiense TaxID=763782 RepID=A0A7W8Z4Z3_9ACTN|nr:SRPBCC family protein [Sphaerisporangium krabiense]MBB5627514.1 phenylpropionate dioxygenase-like ring-hydroxylating dioxygenase large terminal subunit [Sphaerisporangium krabiense]
MPPIGPSTLDADVYRDPRRYELERIQVLNRSWQIICRSDQIPEPGDHHVWQGHGESIVITRRDDGGLSGFHNVCQHRGARIVSRSGTGARRFTCRWHNWAYDREGKVVGVPDRHDFDPGSLAGLCAPAVDVDEWGGWVWAVLAGPGVAGPLLDWIGPEIAADLGAYRMEDMRLVEKLEWEVDVNWKVTIDAFSEYYHAQALHNLPPKDVKDGRESTMDVFGRNAMMVVPFMGVLEELRSSLDHTALAICNYSLFPTAVFNSHRLHTQLFRAVPLGVDKTRFEAWELQYVTEDTGYRETADLFWTIFKGVIEQDVMEWVDVAAVARSSAYRQNIFNERECLLTHFHRVCEDMLAGGDGLGLEPERDLTPHKG